MPFGEESPAHLLPQNPLLRRLCSSVHTYKPEGQAPNHSQHSNQNVHFDIPVSLSIIPLMFSSNTTAGPDTQPLRRLTWLDTHKML